MASSEIPSMTSAEAWTFLREQPDSQLVDVRTHEEHYFVGAPDLSPLGKDAFLNPVKTFDIKSRKWANEPAFVSHIKARFPDPNTPIFFICRSGARSLEAARIMSGEGYTACKNISDGFEGPYSDGTKQRRSDLGWKNNGVCAWIQS
eukprot:TRINITY_DN6702_c0_g1_i2.p1 TRINITY_DN6702_c0_g1~~TRINITY_DN6702_c0_g1_i2.p1  ORF type:complete len:147 (+),score=33.22 TRINITY_DN6702_c0_g1_i2:72-512(+)